MLLVYDWRLAILSLLFTPVSYVCAAWMKPFNVQRAGAPPQKAAGAAQHGHAGSGAERRDHRIYGCERNPEGQYEHTLDTYEKTAARSNVWQSAPAAAVSGRVGGGGAVHSVVRGENVPRFRVARMGYCGVHHVSFLLYQADGEILQGGEAVQLGAEGGVSWKRIQPLMKSPETLEPLAVPSAMDVTL